MFKQSQLSRAISRENYEEAAKLKVAIAAATTTDIVSRVMSHLNVGEVFYVTYEKILLLSAAPFFMLVMSNCRKP